MGALPEGRNGRDLGRLEVAHRPGGLVSREERRPLEGSLGSYANAPPGVGRVIAIRIRMADVVGAFTERTFKETASRQGAVVAA
jgi:hypothetical protein